MMMAPPPVFMPPPAPRRSGVGRAILLIMLFLLLGFSLLLNVVSIGGGLLAGGGNGSTVRETIADGSQEAKIAIVPIIGMIDSNMSKQFGRYLDQAEKEKNLKSIIVEIDTPGGTVTASDEIYARLLRFKQDKKVPVVVSMGSLATSGGYYAACAGDYLFVQETTLTGNIGVLMPRFNVSKLMDKWGIEENTIVSEGATYKNAGSMFTPPSPQETKYLQGIADSMFTRFKDVVKAGRGQQLKKLGVDISEVADGRAFTAGEAKQKGLVDEVGYLASAIAHASKIGGNLKNPTVFRYGRTPTLMDIFGAKSSIPGAKAAGDFTVNGVNFNIDRNLIDELATPRVLYLWRGN
jgi:protease-4